MFEVEVRGTPSPQGSKRARPIYRKGKGGKSEFTGKVAQEDMSGGLTDWRNKVYLAAIEVVKAAGSDGPYPLLGPVSLRVVFTMAKPVSAPKRRRTWHVRQPDLSKLLRAVEDALTDAGVWRDDCLVVTVTARKAYPGEDPGTLPVPGARLWVRPVTEADDGGW